MTIIMILFISFSAFASPEIEDAKLSIKSLMAPILAGGSKTRPSGATKFRIDNCPKEKINWMNVLMMKEEVVLTYRFKTGCDIEGTIKPKVFQSFPASLNLRNIKSYSKINAENRITALIEAKPILNFEMRSGVLSGAKSKVRFEADYQVQLNPLKKDGIDKNLGGELRITEINGKKVSIKEKILVK